MDTVNSSEHVKKISLLYHDMQQLVFVVLFSDCVVYNEDIHWQTVHNLYELDKGEGAVSI